MRIVNSKTFTGGIFHDYYDSVMGYGFDESVIYERTQKLITDFRDVPIQSLLDFRKSLPLETCHFSVQHLGFCGVIYPIFHCMGESAYCLEDLIKKLENKPNHKLDSRTGYYNKYAVNIKEYLEEEITWIYHGDRDHRQLKKPKKRSEFFNGMDEARDLTLFHYFHTPCFLFYSDHRGVDHLLLNPCLKDFNWHKREGFDAFQTFQQIDQFISGVLIQHEKSDTNRTDKLICESKGHDYKTSFRKGKQY